MKGHLVDLARSWDASARQATLQPETRVTVRASPAPSRPNRHTQPANEFVYFLAAEGHAESLNSEHVRHSSGDCVACGKAWPCNWRRITDQALEISPPARLGEQP